MTCIKVPNPLEVVPDLAAISALDLPLCAMLVSRENS